LSTVGATGAGAATQNVRLNRVGTGNVTNAVYVAFEKAGGATATIEQRATAGINIIAAVVTAPSDYRLKDDLGPVVDGLDRVRQLRPRHIRWHGSGDIDETFIAHEVADVLPALVRGDKDGDAIQTIRETGLLPDIVSAVQELAARIESLEGN